MRQRHEAIPHHVSGGGFRQCRRRLWHCVVTQMLVFPLFGLSTTLADNMAMGAIFTVVSIARSFTLRRVFEAIRMRRANEATAAPKGRRP
jgi:hypothetical protein